MTSTRFKSMLVGTCIALVAAVTVVPASAQMAVFDPTNYSQNVLQAVRALQQVNNQIQSLQHEAQMLQNMATNLKRLDVSALAKINGDMARINALMAQAKGIAFTLQQTRDAFAAQFPSSYSTALKTSQMVSDAQTRWDSVMGAYQQTLMVQAQIDEALQTDAASLSQLLQASEDSQGDLQAQQAANQLLALTAKQQMQIQTLMAAQYRADALDAARKAQAEAAGRVATRKFLGSGSAYTPQ